MTESAVHWTKWKPNLHDIHNNLPISDNHLELVIGKFDALLLSDILYLTLEKQMVKEYFRDK